MRSLKKPKRPKVMKYTEEQKTKLVEELWFKSHKKLYNFLCRYPMSPEEREDTVQEAFARAFKSLESFKGESSLETWLFKIAKNIRLNRIRYNHVIKRDQAGFDIKCYFGIQARKGLGETVTDPLIEAELNRIVNGVIESRYKLAVKKKWKEVMREIFINHTDLTYDELSKIYRVSSVAMRKEKFRTAQRIADRLRALKAI